MKAFKPSERYTQNEDVDLDLTPIMNLVIVLIPMLLSMAAFTKIALLEYLPPAEAAESDASEAPAEGAGDGGAGEQKINLILNLLKDGIQVSMHGAIKEGPHFYTIPMLPAGDYDYKALSDSLLSIKRNEIGSPTGVDSVRNEVTGQVTVVDKFKFLDGRDVSITADGETPFQMIVNTMDICRFVESETPEGVKERVELFPNTMLKQFQ